MGAPSVAFQKVIGHSDQYSNTSSCYTISCSPTTIEAATVEATLDTQATSTTNQTNTAPTTTTSNQPNPRAHRQHLQHQHHQQQHQLQHFSHYCQDIASQPSNNHFYQLQEQAIRFQTHQLGPGHLVHQAQPSNTAYFFEAGHNLQPVAQHPIYSPLVAHALHHQQSHAPALYPAGAAAATTSYHIPFGSQPTFHTNAHRNTARAHPSHHHHPALLAGSSLQPGANGDNPSYQYYSNQNSGPEKTSDSARSPSPVRSSTAKAGSTTQMPERDRAEGEETAPAADDDGMPSRSTKGPSTALPEIATAAVNTCLPARPTAGCYQALVQPATYYLTSGPAAATTPAGFFLMSAYPIFTPPPPQANYHPTDYLIQQQHYHQQAGFHQHFYTHPMMAPAAQQPLYVAPPAFNQLKSGCNLSSLLPIDAQPTQTRQAYGMDKVWQDEFECLFSQFISSNVAWTLVEVETNPSIRDSDKIIAYSGRYIIRAETDDGAVNGSDICCADCEFPTPTTCEQDAGESQSCCGHKEVTEVVDSESSPSDSGQQDGGLNECSSEIHDRARDKVSSSASEDSGEADLKSVGTESDVETTNTDKQQLIDDHLAVYDEHEHEHETETDQEREKGGEQAGCSGDSGESIFAGETVQERGEIAVAEIESDCDSGAQVNSNGGSNSSSSSSSSSSGSSGSHNDEPVTSTLTETNSEILRSLDHPQHSSTLIKEATSLGDESRPVGGRTAGRRRDFLKRFRMFIDSAKVRFCCDHCGHGWTSMKGRVVFWYELFEVVDLPPVNDQTMSMSGSAGGKMIGYCAYKLFGQQCDVCKIENRFERPMWYPEEVTKVLTNLYNKIGQVYFGFKMPAIDKQRRAGKPKTSHNSSLCQACHDGVCTDRK